MRGAALIAVGIVAAPLAARADGLDLEDLFRRSQAMIESLIGPGSGDARELIAPPGNIDPQMAFEPPRSAGTIRIIRPTEPLEQRR